MNFTKLQAAGNDFVLIDAQDMDGSDLVAFRQNIGHHHVDHDHS